MNQRSYSRQFGQIPFLSLAAPWGLQGILLICAIHGHPPFFGNTAADAYTGGSGPISGTVLFLIRVVIWLTTLFFLFPLSLFSSSRKGNILSMERLLLLSLPVLALTSTAWSIAPKITLGVSFELFLLTLAGISIATSFPPSQQMQLFMITGVVAALSSLLLAGLDPTDGLDPYGHVGAIKGIFTHKNSCGFFMAVLSTPGFFLRRAMKMSHIVVVAYLLLCAGMVVLSQSRTAWIDFLLIAMLSVALPLLRSFRTRDSFIVFAVITGSVAATVVFLLANLDTVVEFLGKDASFSGRTLIWGAVFSAISKKIFLGYGYAAFFSSMDAGAGSLVMSTRFVVNHPHNGYLSIWLDLGLVGLSLFGLIVLKAIVNAVNVWRASPYTDWYICLILLTLMENVSEVGLAAANDLSWLLFVIACTGLHQATHTGDLRVPQRAHNDLPVHRSFQPMPAAEA